MAEKRRAQKKEEYKSTPACLCSTQRTLNENNWHAAKFLYRQRDSNKLISRITLTWDQWAVVQYTRSSMWGKAH